MSILNNAILVGKETTYGTAATLTRSYEGQADTFKRSQEFLGSVGFRGGMQTQLSTRSVPVNMGGEGSLEVDVQRTGFGLLFQSMLGSTTTTALATPAQRHTFASTAAGPSDSWTVQVQRMDAGDTPTKRNFTHLGSVMTGWTLEQEVGSVLKATFDFDFQDVNTSTAEGTPTYVNDQPYTWSNCAATWNGNAIALTSWSLEGDLGFKTDRRFLRGSELKKRPIRASVPTFEGSAEMEFESLTQYNAFVAGTIAPMVVTWTGPIITGAVAYELKVTLSAVQFQGDSPEVSLDDMPKQALPFKALWDGTATPAVQIEYTTNSATL
jgi:hypothetical protein